jgi:release factor glutamine methyltransferase
MDDKRAIMQLQKFKNYFFLELAKSYPETEIQSFFNILIESRLNLTRVEVALNPSPKFNEKDLIYFRKALANLKNNIPIQYILGEATFYGLTFKVNNTVLIPRPETEELADWIINDSKKKTQVKILDIGTGSGCIAIALAKNLPNAEIFAIDISAKALETAKLNSTTNKVSVHFIESDILSLNKLPHTFDIIVSNPPYVRELEKEQMHKNVLENEPHTALFVKNENPLLFYKKISAFAKTHLNNHGSLYFEINQYLGNETIDLLKSNGFKNIVLKKDIFEVDRMIKATII